MIINIRYSKSNWGNPYLNNKSYEKGLIYYSCLLLITYNVTIITEENYIKNISRTILSSLDYLRHPFSISVFGGKMYWSEWDTHAIYQADKFTGANMTLVTSTDSVHLPMVVQVYHPFRQPDYPNLCLPFNGHCSHLCLPAPGHRSLACRCPPHYSLSLDNRTCTPSGQGRREDRVFVNS